MMMQSHSGGSSLWTPANGIVKGKHWLQMKDPATRWTTDARTTAAGANDPVGSVYDKIGGLYWTQPNTGKRPSVAADGLSLAFDGAKYLGAAISALSWAEVDGQCIRAFIVATPTSITGSSQRHILSSGGYWRDSFVVRVANSTVVGVIGQTLSSTTYSLTKSINTSKQLFELHFDPDTSINHPMYLNVNNGTAATRDTGADKVLGHHSNDTLCCIGAAAQDFATAEAFQFIGNISEIVITSEMTAGEYTDLMTYFQTTHGLSLGV